MVKFDKLIVLVFLLMGSLVSAQTNVYNNGISITIPEGMTLHINGSYVHETEGANEPQVASAGELHLTGDLTNNANNNLFVTNAGKVVLYGDSAQQIIGDSSIHFHALEIDKTTNEVTLEQEIQVLDSLILTGGSIHLNTNDIELSNSGNLIGETNSNRVYGQDGVLRATRSLSGNTGNIAGLGFEIESAANLGTTVIERGHSSQAGASTGGILRFYQLEPTFTGDVLDLVKLNYLDNSEFNGLTEAKFSLWQSENNGIVWNPLVTNPTGVSDQLSAASVSILTNKVLFTVAESTCNTVPVVDLGADTSYFCSTDTLVLDAQNPGLFYFWSTGENTQNLDVTAPGEYNVAVRDANGCVGYDTIQVIEKPYPALSFTVDRVCQNDLSSFINTSTINEDTMSFHWDFGVTTLESDTTSEVQTSYAYDTSGVYTVELSAVSDYNCVASIQQTYVVNPIPEVDFSISDICLGSDGVFTNNTTIVPSIGALTYSILENHWDFGVTTLLNDTSDIVSPTYDYLDPNTYSVRLISVTNAGCSDTLVKTLTVHPRATVDFTLSNVCFGNDIAINNASTLSSGVMTYEWDFDDGLSSTNQNPSKTYTSSNQYDVQLKVTTDHSCVDSLTKQVEVYELPQASFVTQDTCANSNVILVNNSTIASTDILSYAWDFGDATTSTDLNPVKSYTNDADYDIKLIVSSDKQCVDSVSESITVHAVPIMDYDFTSVCEGNAITFQNFSQITSGGISYVWDFENGNTSNLKNPIEQFNTAGSYDVLLTATSSQGCINTLTQAVEVYSLPVINIPATVSTCTGTYTLDAENSGSTYLWSDNSTDQTFTVTASGNYTINVTNANNCSATSGVNVSLNSTFIASLGDDVDACDSHILDAGNLGSLSYLWSTGETTRFINTTTSGEYSVEIVDQNGCPGEDTIQVTINETPTVDLGSAIAFCEGESSILDAQNMGSSYLWSNGEVTQTVSVDTAGIYTVEVTTPENCSANGQISIVVNALPVLDLGQDMAVCDSVTLASGVTGLTYLWSDASTDQNLWIDQAGEYWVKITDGNTCSSSDTIAITISPKPIIDLGDDRTICSGEQTTLDAQSAVGTYLWQNNSVESSLVVSSTGTYEVAVTNSFNCTASSSVNVTVEDPIQLDLGNDVVVCSGQSYDFDASNIGSNYTWGSDNGYVSIDQVATVIDSGTYWVEVTTINSCTAIDTIHVAVSQDVVTAEFLAVSTIDVGDTVQFVSVFSPSQVSFDWDFDNGITSTAEDPEHIFQLPGTYAVSLTVSNEHCSATVLKEIEVLQLRETDEPDSFGKLFNEIVSAVVYPNPTHGGFTLKAELEIEGSIQVMLYDILGHELDYRTLNGIQFEESFDVSNLSSGYYYLKLVLGDDSKVVKILRY